MNHTCIYSRQARRHPMQQQRGVVLIISLVLLVIMTLIGTAGIRLITKEERIVAQAYDRNLAFQAAEAALREAEIRIEAAALPSPNTNAACSAYTAGPSSNITVCGAEPTATIPRWISTSFTSWATSTVVGTGSLKITPTYIVEYLGGDMLCAQNTSTTASNCKRYRITAKAAPGDGRASVMLQSIYATYSP